MATQQGISLATHHSLLWPERDASTGPPPLPWSLVPPVPGGCSPWQGGWSRRSILVKDPEGIHSNCPTLATQSLTAHRWAGQTSKLFFPRQDQRPRARLSAGSWRDRLWRSSALRSLGETCGGGTGGSLSSQKHRAWALVSRVQMLLRLQRASPFPENPVVGPPSSSITTAFESLLGSFLPASLRCCQTLQIFWWSFPAPGRFISRSRLSGILFPSTLSLF